MFESRLQTAQVLIVISFLAAVTGILVLALGPIVVGIFFVVISHAAAAIGCYLYADVKGYPALIGIPIGVGLGCVGALCIKVLPDQTEESAIAEEKRLARIGLTSKSKKRRKDPGYEVLDDED